MYFPAELETDYQLSYESPVEDGEGCVEGETAFLLYHSVICIFGYLGV